MSANDDSKVTHDERGVREWIGDGEPDPATGDWTTCGTCGRTWDDSVSTAWTPVPAGRCPFEYDHEPEYDDETYEEPAMTYKEREADRRATMIAMRAIAREALARGIAEQNDVIGDVAAWLVGESDPIEED